LPRRDNIEVSLQRRLRLQPIYGEYAQDLWAVLTLGRGKTSGYYVDVGSGDGIEDSNTYLLDRMGWQGVCIEPFPSNMERRTCQVFPQPVFSESGKKVLFRAAGDVGGIVAAPTPTWDGTRTGWAMLRWWSSSRSDSTKSWRRPRLRAGSIT
jgi:hypothetical protein